MTTPTGQISLSDVRLEIYGSAVGQIDMNDNAVYSLAGEAAGSQISMSQLKGKTWPTFSPVAGTYNQTDNGGVGTATETITASSSVVWTWTATVSSGLTSTVANGGFATSIQFTLSGGLNGRSTAVTVTVGPDTWTINLTASATGGGGTVTL